MAGEQQQSTYLQACIDRLRAGDDAARTELLTNACGRLDRLTRKMLRADPRVGRWEQAEDVCQNAMLRLHRALKVVQPPTVRDFFRLAAAQIRRELIDLARHYFGAEGLGAHHASHPVAASPDPSAAALEPGELTREPSRLAMWSEFHLQIDKLPAEAQEVFDLLWYQGLTQGEAATLLDISERTLQRRWRAACQLLHAALAGELPP